MFIIFYFSLHTLTKCSIVSSNYIKYKSVINNRCTRIFAVYSNRQAKSSHQTNIADEQDTTALTEHQRSFLHNLGKVTPFTESLRYSSHLDRKYHQSRIYQMLWRDNNISERPRYIKYYLLNLGASFINYLKNLVNIIMRLPKF